MGFFNCRLIEWAHFRCHLLRVRTAKDKLFGLRFPESSHESHDPATSPPASLPEDQVRIITDCIRLLKANFSYQKAFTTVEQLDVNLEKCLGEGSIRDVFISRLLIAMKQLVNSAELFEPSLNRNAARKQRSAHDIFRDRQETAAQRAKHSLLVGNTAPRKPSPLRQVTGIDDDWDAPTATDEFSWDDYIAWDRCTVPSKVW